mmetsp:Transcript_29666/g.97021  ORF Transcript_29666/g.97021 Transcript_29666/m.97021 type:complete len:83 (-) Transcript_29666:285-533(-)
MLVIMSSALRPDSVALVGPMSLTWPSFLPQRAFLKTEPSSSHRQRVRLPAAREEDGPAVMPCSQLAPGAAVVRFQPVLARFG